MAWCYDGGTSDLLCELLTQSLLASQIAGEAHRTSGGTILISCERCEILVKPAPSDLPFRWLVTTDDRERPAISIVAVLRRVREVLDPCYATRRCESRPFLWCRRDRGFDPHRLSRRRQDDGAFRLLQRCSRKTKREGLPSNFARQPELHGKADSD
jgi:hypothetical protein